MYSLGAWWWLCFFFVTFSIQTVGVVAAVNKSRDDSGDFDYDSHNPLGHEYESGEDGVERVKCADEFEDMVLMDAIQLADFLLLECFIRKGAKIEYTNEHGFTPLMYASALGQHFSVGTLLKYGAAINAQDHNGWTALHWAADSGENIKSSEAQRRGDHWKTVKLLVNKKANLDIQNEQGLTPLMWATGFGRSDIAVTLIKNGANLYLEDSDGNSVITIARGVLEKLEAVKKTALENAEEWGSDQNEMLMGYSRIYAAIKTEIKKRKKAGEVSNEL